MSKTICAVVPDHSTYVSWGNLDVSMVTTQWHAVYWPPHADQDDFVAYAYGDAHFHHPWSVHGHYAYFENADEAVQFALVFGGVHGTSA